ncbi:MAG: hypothetical protein U1D55_00470 [Phycisphaerae bacterium]
MTNWTQIARLEPASYAGVPFFACDDRLLIVGVIDNGFGRNNCGITVIAFDLGACAESRAMQFDPAYLGPDAQIVGSSIDNERFLLTRCRPDDRSDIVLYNFATRTKQLLCEGEEPIMLASSGRFAFARGGDMYAASLTYPDRAARVGERDRFLVPLPREGRVLGERYTKDPMFLGFPRPSLWELQLDTGEERMVLNHLNMTKLLPRDGIAWLGH